MHITFYLVLSSSETSHPNHIIDENGLPTSRIYSELDIDGKKAKNMVSKWLKYFDSLELSKILASQNNEFNITVPFIFKRRKFMWSNIFLISLFTKVKM